MDTEIQRQLSTSLHIAPVIDWPWLALLIAIGIGLLALSLLRYKSGALIRGIVFSLFIATLLNPSLLKEDRSYTKDVAIIVVDQSPSQNFGERENTTNKALKYISGALKDSDALDIRVIKAPKDTGLTNKTDLFEAIDQTLADVPQKRRAGVIIISDGQIHDVPKNIEDEDKYGPVHLLLSGKKNEKDRHITLTNASAYGLVGKNIIIKYIVEDTDNIQQTHARVTLKLNDGSKQDFYVPVNEEQSISLNISNPGSNVFSLETDSVEEEITLANNKTALLVNGVRDRMKVMLISGVPHSGERTWRDLLTSDPGVDLVHFTILREPQKLDYTPKEELSLIAFPFDELFEVKLYDFDLIIFDQYKLNNILPDKYFYNIVRYVRNGGAFLEASGPAFAGNDSIYDTPLEEILPGAPTGHITEEKFTPSITEIGFQHPVTKDLIWNNKKIAAKGDENWGTWLRYIDIKSKEGDVLMQTPAKKPLLILDRIGKGRVAQLSSDHIWLWSRGYDGGGPHSELLRRIVHWLMKEPELDERALNVSVNKDVITIRKQGYVKTEESVTMTNPDGKIDNIELKASDTGTNILSYTHKAEQLGIYAFEDKDMMRKFAVIGELNPLELGDVITTGSKAEALVNASKGSIIWLNDVPNPKIKISDKSRRYGGDNWIALKKNSDFTVTGIKDIPLMPEWAILIILFSSLLALWWKEGRK